MKKNWIFLRNDCRFENVLAYNYFIGKTKNNLKKGDVIFYKIKIYNHPNFPATKTLCLCKVVDFVNNIYVIDVIGVDIND